jgi:hypothetical protein
MEEPTEGDPKSVTGQVSSVQLPDISFLYKLYKMKFTMNRSYYINFTL